MNTPSNKTTSYRLGLTALAACVAALPVRADEAIRTQEVVVKQPAASRQESIGVVTGLAVGAAAGGPVGAIVGAAAGAWLGDRYHKQMVARAELTTNLDRSESDRVGLQRSVTALNGSLAQEQARGEQLDTALSQTDEVEMDVNFRTNDDSVRTQSISGLLKLGALAAALPDAKVRVAGYADARGSDAVNNALSKRRAEAVAAVLGSAGLSKDRLIVEAHGKSAATGNEGDVDGYALDRHVTVRIERANTQSAALIQ